MGWNVLFQKKQPKETHDRTNRIKTPEEQALAVTQLLAEEAPPPIGAFSLFGVDCTANPRIHAKKVTDAVHAPNHIPGQKPITVGHQYS